jgi:hypothetical protein
LSNRMYPIHECILDSNDSGYAALISPETASKIGPTK